MTSGRYASLELARRDAGVTIEDLWLMYFGLGGERSVSDIEAYLVGTTVPTDHEHDLLAHALNEHFLAQGGDHPVPYADERE